MTPCIAPSLAAFTPSLNTTNPPVRIAFAPSTDHALTIDMAKEIAMLQRSDKGKQARQYFIKVEEKFKALTPQTYLEALKALVESEEEKQRLAEENKVLEIALDESEAFATVVKYAKLNGYIWRNRQASAIGKRLSQYCRDKGIQYKRCMDDSGKYGEVNTYPLSAWSDFSAIYPDIL